MRPTCLILLFLMPSLANAELVTVETVAGQAVFTVQPRKAGGFPVMYLSNGDTTRVLHASAKLGELRFRKAEDAWVPEAKDYRWFETMAPSDWTASTMPFDDGMRFTLDCGLMSQFRVALAYVHMGERGLMAETWPARLDDDVASVELAVGEIPDTADFRPASWLSLDKACE